MADTRLTLLIANKNYSSWSMRPWLVLKHFGIAFDELQLSLKDPLWAAKVGRFSPALRVPVLIDGDFTVWDTLAIFEYLAERHPEFEIWPGAARARARARSLCAEMHAGFQALRNQWPMNISAHLPGHPGDGEVDAQVRRISDMWQDALSASGGPFLFGRFSAVDAMYAPIVMRFRTYEVALPDAARAYCDKVEADHAVVEWCAAAQLETEFISDDEPYRTDPGES
jgi:glutathione S-transferase